MAESKLKLQKWLQASYLYHVSGNSLSSVELGKTIGIKQSTAWFLLHRIKKAVDERYGWFSGEESNQERPLPFTTHGDVVDALVAPSQKRTLTDTRLYCQSCFTMNQCKDDSIPLTLTSPPYWNAIDYDLHANNEADVWYREREYQGFGRTFEEYLENIRQVFSEVYRVTVEGGFCAIVVGTILSEGKHYPAPMLITERMGSIGWEFHQDIIWNKVTGGVKRARVFIRNTKTGYYYPNIMTEYILIFRKPGEKRRGHASSLDIDELFKRDIANNVWHIAPVPPNQIAHPCPFPEELARRVILLYSDEGDEVLDPFLGSGQTALAAIRNGRKCVGYEVEPSYIGLTEDRLQAQPATRAFNIVPKYEKIRATP